MIKRIAAIVLCLVLALPTLLSLSGCKTLATDLMAGIQANSIETEVDLSGEAAVAVTDFSVRLFQQNVESDRNTCLSPISVLCTLALVANGAKGETRTQMEDVFGMSVEELNAYLHAYINLLPEDEKYKLRVANSIWLKNDESFTVNQDFLQTNADYYGAGVYQAAFDQSTVRAVNRWVSDNTNGMVGDILDKIPEEAVMYLVNALTFDAEWQEIYMENQVQSGVFTKEDGTMRDVEFMYSTEGQYLEDEDAVGFIKYYAGREYAFVAMLPREGIGVADYICSLTGEKLHEILTNAKPADVEAAIPKFKSEYSIEMKESLQAMGMTDAFDLLAADLSGIGSSAAGNLAISRIQHKSYIAVDEKGTEAGAATIMEVLSSSADDKPTKTVYLDRPFVYMLIDCKAKLPLFMGSVMDIGQ